jgi:hypothetical protein
MKRQKSCGPRLGKLVHQLPGVVTFAYDLRFRRVIARWKGIVEEIHFGGSIMPLDIIENLDLKKPSFRPSKWPRKLKPAKNSKLPKLPENCFEPVGKGGWPPISTWIIVNGSKGIVDVREGRTFRHLPCNECLISMRSQLKWNSYPWYCASLQSSSNWFTRYYAQFICSPSMHFHARSTMNPVTWVGRFL